MPIDGCTHSWSHLSSVVLPEYMAKMRAAIASPNSMSVFAGVQRGQGEAYCAKQLGYAKDFSGCYVLIEAGRPLYTGISRRVMSRLLQHVKGEDSNSASLAYLIAKLGNPHKLFRKAAMELEEFKRAFGAARERLGQMDVALVEITCPVELYAFELFCSMELDTAEWNSFRTH
jgi:predicted GIY-YIG superfamily endonuclease